MHTCETTRNVYAENILSIIKHLQQIQGLLLQTYPRTNFVVFFQLVNNKVPTIYISIDTNWTSMTLSFLVNQE